MTDYYDEFDHGADILAGLIEPDHTPEPVAAPRDAHEADRLLRRIARLDAERAEAHSRYEQLRHELDAWHGDVVGGIDRQLEYLEGVVCDWARANGLTKQAKLPHGTVKTTKGRVSLVVTNREAAVAWARNTGRDGLIRQAAPDIDRQALAKIVATEALSGEGADEMPAVVGDIADGEVVPGVIMTTAGRTWKVAR